MGNHLRPLMEMHRNAQQLEVLTLMCNFQDDVPTIPNMSMSQLIGCFFSLIDPVVSPSPLCHPSAHSGGKLCQLNRLQTQPHTTKCCLYLDHLPCYKMLLGFLMADQWPMLLTTKCILSIEGEGCETIL